MADLKLERDKDTQALLASNEELLKKFQNEKDIIKRLNKLERELDFLLNKLRKFDIVK